MPVSWADWTKKRIIITMLGNGLKFSTFLSVVLMSVVVFAYNNCVPVTDSGVLSNSGIPDRMPGESGRSLGNGNGYVGIDAPIAVKADSEYVATAVGGVKPFKFELVSGPAKIVQVTESSVRVQVDKDSSGQEIKLALTDGNGIVAESSTFVISISNPYRATDIKTGWHSPRVKVRNNMAVIGNASTHFFDFKRMDYSYGENFFDYSQMEAGYLSLHQHDGQGTNWQLNSHIGGREVARYIAEELGEEWVIPYDFGGYFDFDGKILAVRFGFMRKSQAHRSWSISSLERAVSLFKIDEDSQRLSYVGSVVSDMQYDRTATLNKKIFVGDGQFFAVDEFAKGLVDRMTVYNIANPDQPLQTLLGHADDTIVKELKVIDDQLFVFLSPTVSSAGFKPSATAVVKIYEKQGDLWQHKADLPVSSGGSAISASIQKEKIIVNHLMAEKKDSNGIYIYPQKIVEWNYTDGEWLPDKGVLYTDHSICHEMAAFSSSGFVLGCATQRIGHVHSGSVQAAHDSGVEIAHLQGTGIVFLRVGDTWALSEKLYEPEGGDTNYAGFGWSVSGSDGIFGISHFHTEKVKVYRVKSFGAQ